MLCDGVKRGEGVGMKELEGGEGRSVKMKGKEGERE